MNLELAYRMVLLDVIKHLSTEQTLDRSSIKTLQEQLICEKNRLANSEYDFDKAKNKITDLEEIINSFSEPSKYHDIEDYYKDDEVKE